MRKMMAGALVVMMLACAFPAFAADEELFDTKAAASSIEKGKKLLSQKKYDAAIEAFEDAISAAPDAESYYLLGYAYYIKGKAGDEASRQKAREYFEEVYNINPNFSPSKFRVPEVMAAPGSQPAAGSATPASIAPAGKLEIPPAAPAPATAPASQPAPSAEPVPQPAPPAEQPKQ
ncbi:MAG: hypothetical protein M0042_03880 [Nitrospiraceae bacterium]|nr:hypothetical protein [Nitrospiraceae bacterium]